MTPSFMPTLRSSLITLALLATGAGVACTGSRTEGLDPSKLPQEVRADYEVFARRCSKCHSLARPLTSGITDDEQWVMYVNRMRRQPGSGISHADQEQILRFLRFYAADLRRKASEKKTPPPPPASESPPPPSTPLQPAPASSPAQKGDG